MKALLVAVVAALCVSYVAAECANACSGHGTCEEKDHCACYREWQGADCSQRACPFGLAFVDSPVGDLNHDDDVSGTSDVDWAVTHQAELYPDSPTAEDAHYYMECSNKGLCDRSSGICKCFDGFEGGACERRSCPNNCNGRGVCRTVAQIARGALTESEVKNAGGIVYKTGVTEAHDYMLWDMHKNQACVCDAGYTGPDCSLRKCPRGDDPLTYRTEDCGGSDCTVETQTVSPLCSADGTCAGTFTLTFTDWTGKAWETAPITYVQTDSDASGTAAALATALKALPEDVITDVTVADVTPLGSNVGVLYTISFTANPGNLPLMTCDTSGITTGTMTSCVVAATVEGTNEAVECSNRGICDTDSGVCKCFRGYSGVDCSMQNALAQS
jgi:hypothetical protein